MTEHRSGGSAGRPPAQLQRASSGGAESSGAGFTAAFDAALEAGRLQECLELLRGRAGAERERPLDARRHGAFLEACFLGRCGGTALEYVRLLRPPDPRCYNALVRAAGKHRALGLLPAIEAAQQGAGLPADSHSQAALITALASNRGREAEALAAFERSWAQLPPCRTLAVANAGVAAAAAAGDWGRAQAALELLQQVRAGRQLLLDRPATAAPAFCLEASEPCSPCIVLLSCPMPVAARAGRCGCWGTKE